MFGREIAEEVEVLNEMAPRLVSEDAVDAGGPFATGSAVPILPRGKGGGMEFGRAGGQVGPSLLKKLKKDRV